MKRLLEESISEGEIDYPTTPSSNSEELKRARTEEIYLSSSDGSSSDGSSSDGSSSDGSLEIQVQEIVCNDFEPNEVEKEVIRKSIAMIGRTNMSDWDLEHSFEGGEQMLLSEIGIINIDGPVTVEIINRLVYGKHMTECQICYRLGDQSEWNELAIDWDKNVNGGLWMTIYKTKIESCLWIFDRSVHQICEIKVSGDRDSAWCFFLDARLHLNRICYY